jgi:hypothetical protein
MSLINLHALVKNLAEPLNFLDGCLVPFLHLLDDLEWPMLFAEHSVGLVSACADDCTITELPTLSAVASIRVFVLPAFLNLHAVVGPASTLDVECDLASLVLTLHARPILLEADNALQVEALLIELAQTDSGLRRYRGTWDPGGTAEVHPLVLSGHEAWVGATCQSLKVRLISLNEERVVLRYPILLTWEISEFHILQTLNHGKEGVSIGQLVKLFIRILKIIGLERSFSLRLLFLLVKFHEMPYFCPKV